MTYLFTSLDAPEMQSYLDTLSSGDDPFEILAAKEEEEGCPLVVPNQPIN